VAASRVSRLFVLFLLKFLGVVKVSMVFYFVSKCIGAY